MSTQISNGIRYPPHRLGNNNNDHEATTTDNFSNVRVNEKLCNIDITMHIKSF